MNQRLHLHQSHCRPVCLCSARHGAYKPLPSPLLTLSNLNLPLNLLPVPVHVASNCANSAQLPLTVVNYQATSRLREASKLIMHIVLRRWRGEGGVGVCSLDEWRLWCQMCKLRAQRVTGTTRCSRQSISKNECLLYCNTSRHRATFPSRVYPYMSRGTHQFVSHVSEARTCTRSADLTQYSIAQFGGSKKIYCQQLLWRRLCFMHLFYFFVGCVAYRHGLGFAVATFIYFEIRYTALIFAAVFWFCTENKVI